MEAGTLTWWGDVYCAPLGYCLGGWRPWGPSARPGTFLCGWGPSTPSGTEILSPDARGVPLREGMHPAARNVPRP